MMAENAVGICELIAVVLERAYADLNRGTGNVIFCFVW